jgi:hypothetical protein
MPHYAPQPDDLRASVIDRFGKIATTLGQERRFPVGPESAKRLGYDVLVVDSLPSSLTESFGGVGNPLTLGEPQPGQVARDLPRRSRELAVELRLEDLAGRADQVAKVAVGVEVPFEVEQGLKTPSGPVAAAA